ncbi:MAG: hypothetical protein O3B84_05760, partial [Chloroflexi bacterium]|nr:hypothetical protein [Chloroflexota bacterium]
MRALLALVAALVVCGPLACSGDLTGTGGQPEVPDITYIVMARITAGTSHSCAISGLGSGLPLGSGFCWGLNDYNQLGDAGSDGEPNGEHSEVALEPVPISGNLLFLRLQAGGVFTCGIHPVDGLVYCWGGGLVGGDTRTPTPVSDQLRFRELSAGENHICAEMSDTRAVYCWGENDSGQLGDGSTSRSSSPIAVAGLIAKSFSSGVTHTCVVLDSGEGLCWGDATSGKLGDGSTGGIQSSPVTVAGNLDLAGIGTGRDHSCAITVAGAAYCWGSNEFGQL